MPIPAIKGILVVPVSVQEQYQVRCDILFTPHVGQSSVIYQQVMRMCITLTESDGIVNLLCALCYFLSFYLQVELELKSKESQFISSVYTCVMALIS